MGLIQFDFYCVVRCVKQRRGQKCVSTALFAITKLIQHRFIKSLVSQLGRNSHSEEKLRSSQMSL